MSYPHRFILFLAVLGGLAASLPSNVLAKEEGVTITRVFPGWRDTTSFKRISEYFSGQENTAGTIVLRTHPDQRGGFYFLVRVDNSGVPADVKINLELVTPTDSQPKNYSFTSNLKAGETVLNLGLTGSDWPDAKANPVAWKIDLLGTDGRVLASEKSYLWERPTTK